MFIDIERVDQVEPKAENSTPEVEDRKTEQGQQARDAVKEARELLSKATPWPFLTKWNGAIGHTIYGNDGSGSCIAIVSGVAPGVTTQQGRTNAQLFARAPELLSAMADEIEALRRDRNAVREQVDQLVNSDFVCSRCGSQKK